MGLFSKDIIYNLQDLCLPFNILINCSMDGNLNVSNVTQLFGLELILLVLRLVYSLFMQKIY